MYITDNSLCCMLAVTRNENKPRLYLNDIIVTSVDVTGGTLDYPKLRPRDHEDHSGSHSGYHSGYQSGDGSGLYYEHQYFYDKSHQDGQGDSDDDDPLFIMIMSEFQIAYSVLDCGHGLPLPTGYYDVDSYEPMSLEVEITQVNT